MAQLETDAHKREGRQRQLCEMIAERHQKKTHKDALAGYVAEWKKDKEDHAAIVLTFQPIWHHSVKVEKWKMQRCYFRIIHRIHKHAVHRTNATKTSNTLAQCRHIVRPSAWPLTFRVVTHALGNVECSHPLWFLHIRTGWTDRQTDRRTGKTRNADDRVIKFNKCKTRFQCREN